MRPRQLFLAALAVASSVAMTAPQAHGQRPLRRLIERVAPLIASPEDQSGANQLPARPLQERSDGRADARAEGTAPKTAPGVNQATNRANPAARYRVPGATPAATPGATPGGREPAGSFGRSILKPLDFDGSNADPASSYPASADPDQASLGIKGVEANPGYPAVQVTAISEYSMAVRDGLRVGDYIFAIDGIPTPNVRVLADHVSKLEPGQRVRLRIGRSRQVVDVDVTLVSKGGDSSGQPTASQPTASQPIQRAPITPAATAPDLPPQPAKQPQIGAEVNEIAGRRGVVVATIQPGSPADQAGILKGDRIVSIDKRLVYGTASFGELLATNATGSIAEIQLVRDSQLVNVTLDLDAKSSPTVSAITGDEAKSRQDPPSGQNTTGTSGFAGGLGSVLGGMFGTKPAAATNKPTQEEQPVAVNAELPAPQPDALALEPEDSKEQESEDDVALREQIERLKQQLKSLESRLDD